MIGFVDSPVELQAAMVCVKKKVLNPAFSRSTMMEISNSSYRICNFGQYYIHTYITFLVFRTQQGSQQTITGRVLRMSNLNDTIHSMLF